MTTTYCGAAGSQNEATVTRQSQNGTSIQPAPNVPPSSMAGVHEEPGAVPTGTKVDGIAKTRVSPVADLPAPKDHDLITFVPEHFILNFIGT